MIDVGGPSMLRAAAKNFAHVAAVCRPRASTTTCWPSCASRSARSRRGGRSPREAFAATAAYDAAIAAWFGEGDSFPATLTLAFEHVLELAYGENPHQRAAYYAERGAPHAPARAGGADPRQRALVQQPQRPRTPLAPAARARAAGLRDRQAREPVRIALGATIEEAYERALAADPVRPTAASSCSTARERCAGERLAEQFVEALLAAGYDVAAEALVRKPSVRILNDLERRVLPGDERDLASPGGLLVQDRDCEVDDRPGMEVVSGAADEPPGGALCLAGRQARDLQRDRAGEGLQTIGVGGGQVSRVDAVRIAVEKARGLGHSLDGAVLASDAFFPFADGRLIALEAGVRAIVQPGGSKRDDEVMAVGGGACRHHRPAALPADGSALDMRRRAELIDEEPRRRCEHPHRTRVRRDAASSFAHVTGRRRADGGLWGAGAVAAHRRRRRHALVLEPATGTDPHAPLLGRCRLRTRVEASGRCGRELRGTRSVLGAHGTGSYAAGGLRRAGGAEVRAAAGRRRRRARRPGAALVGRHRSPERRWSSSGRRSTWRGGSARRGAATLTARSHRLARRGGPRARMAAANGG